MFLKFFTGSEVTVFVTVIMTACMDFWVVKNITGRVLIGLRWWTAADFTDEDFVTLNSGSNAENPSKRKKDKNEPKKKTARQVLDDSDDDEAERLSILTPVVEYDREPGSDDSVYSDDQAGSNDGEEDEDDDSYDSQEDVTHDREDEEYNPNQLYFESYDHNAKNSRVDTHIFWWMQGISVIFWGIWLVINVISLNLFWVIF